MLSLVSQTFIVPSIDAPATQVPSGVNLHERTAALCSLKVDDTIDFYMSQSFTVLSSEQDNIILWSGEIVHSRTQLVCPMNDCLNFPSGFHILTVLSEEQLIKKSSSLDRAILRTAPEWAFTDLCLPLLSNIKFTQCSSRFEFLCLLRMSKLLWPEH